MTDSTKNRILVTGTDGGLSLSLVKGRPQYAIQDPPKLSWAARRQSAGRSSRLDAAEAIFKSGLQRWNLQEPMYVNYQGIPLAS